jgi:hypothetical protein
VGRYAQSAGDDLPDSGTDQDAGLGFPKLSATIALAPYGAYAATKCQRH